MLYLGANQDNTKFRKMGVEVSRGEVVDLEKATDCRKIEFWKEKKYIEYNKSLSSISIGSSTEHTSHICSVINAYIALSNMSYPVVLEVGSGNGLVTSIIQKLTKLKIIATDLIKYDKLFYDVEAYLPSHEAVKKYESKFDILLLVCPLPNCYMDYYAIKEYELQKSTKKCVIFVGELGGAEGGPGMYQYMLYKSAWKLAFRDVLERRPDTFGGLCEKEIFIFTIS